MPLVHKVSKHMWEMPASDYIGKISTLTPKLWLFKMPDIQNYLLGFRRAVQSYKSWFSNKSSSGSKDQNNPRMMQLLEWAKPDFTRQRHYRERLHTLLEFFVHFWMVALGFLFCSHSVLNWELPQALTGYPRLWVEINPGLLPPQRHSRTSGPLSCRANTDKEKEKMGRVPLPRYQSKSSIRWGSWEISAHLQ